MVGPIVSSIVKGFIEHILVTLVVLLWWLTMFPVVWVLALPFILVIALFARGPYKDAAARMFSNVHEFWRGWGVSHFLGDRFKLGRNANGKNRTV